MTKPRLVVNMMANWGGQTLVALVGFVVTPLILSRIGVEAYGLLTLAISVTSQLILFDLGIATSLTRQLPFHTARGKSEELEELIASGGFLLSLASLGVVLAMLAGHTFLPDFFSVPAAHHALFRTLLWIFTADVAIEVVAGLFLGILGGHERFVLMNQLNVARSLVNAGATVVVLLLGGGVIELALTTVLTRFLYRVALMLHARKLTRVSGSRVSRAGCNAVLSFGIWVGLAHLATRVISQIDPLVVGAYLGAVAAGRYAPALMITDQLRLLAQLACTPLTPRMSVMFAEQRHDEIREVLLRWAESIQLLLAALTVPIALNGGDFLVLWVGHEFAESGLVLTLLALAVIAATPGAACAAYLYASGGQARYGKLLMLEAVLNLGLSLTLVRWLGAPGVALGTLVAATVVGLVALPRAAASSLGADLHRFYVRAYGRPLAFMAAYAAVILALESLIGCDGWGRFFGVHVTAGLLWAAFLWKRGILREI